MGGKGGTIHQHPHCDDWRWKGKEKGHQRKGKGVSQKEKGREGFKKKRHIYVTDTSLRSGKREKLRQKEDLKVAKDGKPKKRMKEASTFPITR